MSVIDLALLDPLTISILSCGTLSVATVHIRHCTRNTVVSSTDYFALCADGYACTSGVTTRVVC